MLGDLDMIVALEAECFGVDAWSRDQVCAELDADRVVLVDDSPGWLSITVAGEVADLLRIAVSPGSRRRGVATRLLHAGLGAVGGLGARRMLLEVAASNVAARAFYERHGFAPVHRRRRYYASGEDAIVMEHVLD